MHFWGNPIVPHLAHQADVAAPSRLAHSQGTPKGTYQAADGCSVPQPDHSHDPQKVSHMAASTTLFPL